VLEIASAVNYAQHLDATWDFSIENQILTDGPAAHAEAEIGERLAGFGLPAIMTTLSSMRRKMLSADSGLSFAI
jgi:hypothetical protein